MSDRGLGRRPWIWARGVPLVAGGLTLAGLIAGAALTGDQPRGTRMLILLGVLVLGAGLYLAARAVAGTQAVLRRLAATRRRWAAGHGWSYDGDHAPVPAEASALALPHGWQPPRALAALTGRFADRDARVQTWMLRSRPTSRRQPAHREVVILTARTGEHRCAVLSGPQPDPLLITPAWANPGRGDLDAATGTLAAGDPDAVAAWAPAIQTAVAACEDLPLTVSVGQDQVIVFALDDPRTTTMCRRLQLAAQVAQIVEGSGSRFS